MAIPMTIGSTREAESASQARHAEGLVDDPAADARDDQCDDGPEHRKRYEQGDESHAVGVGDRNHDERRDVVDDRDGEQERPQPIRRPASDKSQHAQRKGGIGGHGDGPTVC